MPNLRRRRFSVHHEVADSSPLARDPSRDPNAVIQCPLEVLPSPACVKAVTSRVARNHWDQKQGVQGFTASRLESATCTSVGPAADVSLGPAADATRADKDATASSSTIDFYSLLAVSAAGLTPTNDQQQVRVITGKAKKKCHTRQDTSTERLKKRHQHRVKVRSPRRRMADEDPRPPLRRSVGTAPIDWEQEGARCVESVLVTTVLDDVSAVDRGSCHSLEPMCRICHGGESLSSELGDLISACSCRGTVGRVHVQCLERWLTESGKSRCELCGARYLTRRVHRYGVPRALLMWIFSQNAKQLMVDSLGIMLMSPLAVLAAWLSGRTLAGLMTQDPSVTPWPLASTFVLACMTLVCYYCWIVSAATRHALGWWIWYRSHYQVRLQLDQGPD